MSIKSEKAAARAEAIATLLTILKPGDTVYGIVRQVSRSGIHLRSSTMQTIEVLHNRALRAAGGASDRAIRSDSYRLANLADSIRDSVQRAYWRQDEGLMRRAISAASSIGRRVRKAGAL